MSEEPAASPKLVRDLMTVGVVTCSPRLTLAEAARLLLEKDLEGVVVLDDEGHGVGIVTQDEIVQGYAHPNRDSLTVGDIMREGVPELPPDIPLTAAAGLMRDMGLRVVFFMHNANGIIYPAAMLSYRHFLRHLAAESAEELRDLGIRAEREPPLASFKRRLDATRRQP